MTPILSNASGAGLPEQSIDLTFTFVFGHEYYPISWLCLGLFNQTMLFCDRP